MSVCYSDLPESVLTMIDTSIGLCESLLRYTDTFYPFAAIDLDGDLQAVFSHDASESHQNQQFIDDPSFEYSLGESENLGMIERLEQDILNQTLHVSKANSVLVYAAFVEAKENEFADVIVADVNLYEGSTQQFYFPVIYGSENVSIGSPFTNQPL